MQRFVALLLAGLVVLVVAPCGSDAETDATEAPDEGPLTIMQIGDSITQSAAAWCTYRCFLDGMLKDAGVAFDFVGSRSAPHGGTSYRCPTEFDEDHEGYWGWKVDQMIEVATVQARDLQPDVALVHLGTNDISLGEGPESTASELAELVTGLQGVQPDITVLVAQIIPCVGRQCHEGVPAYNDAIASFTDLSTDASQVIVVGMNTGFEWSGLRDSWHPDDSGEQVMAARWMEALEGAGMV